MTVWYNKTERDCWVERWCRMCFQPDEATLRVTGKGEGCPHKAKGDEGKTPSVWTKKRGAVFGETYSCSEFLKKPPPNRRGNAPADTVAMFDVEPDEYKLVPVEGWKDYRDYGKKQKEGDHQ